MFREAHHAPSLLCGLLVGCTGAIPEPLELGDAVEPGGWLLIDNGEDPAVILQRVDDGDAPAFLDAHDAAFRSVDLRAERPLSVFSLGSRDLMLLEFWGDARVPELSELSVEERGTSLGECACPVPRFDQTVRFLAGSTCAVLAEHGRTASWEDGAWVWSEGAQGEILLHHGGSACAPSLEKLLDPSFGPALESRVLVRLEGEGEYLHVEDMGDGSVFVAGTRNSGRVQLAAGGQLELPGNPPGAWEVRALLSPTRGSVVGVVARTLGAGQEISLSTLFRAGESLQETVLKDESALSTFRDRVADNERPGLALGESGEFLVETATAMPGLLRVESTLGTVTVAPEFSEVFRTPAAAWVRRADSNSLGLLYRDPVRRAGGGPRFAAEVPFSDRAQSRASSFLRVDLAVVVDANGSADTWSLRLLGLVADRWLDLRRVEFDSGNACGARVPGQMYAAMVGDAPGIVTEDGFLLALDGSCTPLGFQAGVASATSLMEGTEWLLLTRDGNLVEVGPTGFQTGLE